MRLAIIDGDFLLYTCLHGNKVLDVEGNPVKENNKFVYEPKPFEQACQEADNLIVNILNETQCTQYIGFIGGSSRNRKEINPEYKSNRTSDKPDNFVELRKYLVDRWKFDYISDHEVDDYVRSVAKLTDGIIVSPDKDLLNLEGTAYNPKKKIWVTTSKEEAKYYFWKSMLVGDTADNVSGVKGIGEIKAKNILNGITDYAPMVLRTYISTYGEHDGIAEFYKNYRSLYILDNVDVDLTLIQERPKDEFTNNLNIV